MGHLSRCEPPVILTRWTAGTTLHVTNGLDREDFIDVGWRFRYFGVVLGVNALLFARFSVLQVN